MKKLTLGFIALLSITSVHATEWKQILSTGTVLNAVIFKYKDVLYRQHTVVNPSINYVLSRSTDGINWTPINTTGLNSAYVRTYIPYENGIYATAIDTVLRRMVILHSTNGENWDTLVETP